MPNLRELAEQLGLDLPSYPNPCVEMATCSTVPLTYPPPVENTFTWATTASGIVERIRLNRPSVLRAERNFFDLRPHRRYRGTKRLTVRNIQESYPELNLCVRHLNFKHSKEYTLFGVPGWPRFRSLKEVHSFITQALRPRVTTQEGNNLPYA